MPEPENIQVFTKIWIYTLHYNNNNYWILLQFTIAMSKHILDILMSDRSDMVFHGKNINYGNG